MNNEYVVCNFYLRIKGRSKSLVTDGAKLFSYDTVIAQYTSNFGLIINTTKYYSRTTSRHQLMVKILLPPIFRTVSNVPIGADDLTRYL